MLKIQQIFPKLYRCLLYVVFHNLKPQNAGLVDVEKDLNSKRSKGIFVRENLKNRGWSGGAIVLGKLPVPGRPTIWITVGQGPTVLAVGAGGGCLDIFTLIYPFSPLSPSLWETARYRLK